MVRLDVGDDEGVIFTDSLLNRIAVKAVTRLNNKLGIGKTVRPLGVGSQFGGRRISIPPLEIDVVNGTITPDTPEMVDMTVLQMEVIILKGEIAALRRLKNLNGSFNSAASTAAQDDVSVRNADGVSVTMGAGRFSTRARLYEKTLDSVEEELQDAVTAFLARESANFGKMVY